MNSTKIYPGMLDQSIEIFYHEESKTLKAIHEGSVKNYTELPNKATDFLTKIIEKESDVAEILNQWYPNNLEAQKAQLAQCRFGALNFLPDNNESVTHHDMLDCQIIKTCIGCGKICKGYSYEGETLKPKEIQAIPLIVSEKKNIAIADAMNMAEGTFNVFRTHLYEKLGIQSKPELARVGAKLGLI